MTHTKLLSTRFACFSPDGGLLAHANRYTYITSLDNIGGGERIDFIPYPSELVFSNDGGLLAGTKWKNEVCFYDLKKKTTKIFKLKNKIFPMFSLFTADGKNLIITGDFDGDKRQSSVIAVSAEDGSERLLGVFEELFIERIDPCLDGFKILGTLWADSADYGGFAVKDGNVIYRFDSGMSLSGGANIPFDDSRNFSFDTRFARNSEEYLGFDRNCSDEFITFNENGQMASIPIELSDVAKLSYAVSDDGKILALRKVDLDSTHIYLYALPDGVPLEEYDVGIYPESMAFSPDGKFLLVTGEKHGVLCQLTDF